VPARTRIFSSARLRSGAFFSANVTPASSASISATGASASASQLSKRWRSRQNAAQELAS